MSQELIEDPIWRQLLTASTQNVTRVPSERLQQALPSTGPVKGWLLRDGAPLPASMPPFFAELAPGYYGEGQLDTQGDPLYRGKIPVHHSAALGAVRQRCRWHAA
ncbi:hypothetical protein [Xanthomonas campestris]|uniref:Uncharacterized protein n=1 Tax=Xanthomonas campestris pv. papavericola TaxID=487881 RepID=A0AAJ2X726_XANCA|nr:hypothetical protein [Xanthomonas campestris]MEC3890502.1 hypothetical protein [Xanthomonas campestris pv. papavericola]